ncbi:MAG TPA: hypothetical protein VF334_23090, partial [Polyangia bacterium]
PAPPPAPAPAPGASPTGAAPTAGTPAPPAGNPPPPTNATPPATTPAPTTAAPATAAPTTGTPAPAPTATPATPAAPAAAATKTPEEQLADALTAKDAVKVSQLATTDALRAKVLTTVQSDQVFLLALVAQDRNGWCKLVIGVALSTANGGLLKKVATDLPSKTEAVKQAIAQSKTGILLAAIGTSNDPEWKTATNAADYDAIVAATSAPVSIKQISDGLWALWGDGAGRAPAAARTTFEHLFSARIAAAGDTSVTWPGGTSTNAGPPPVTFAWRTVYMPVAPDDAAMKQLLVAVKPLPVGHVNLSTIAFVPQTKQQWQQTAPTPGPWTDYKDASGNVPTTAVGTSYYLDNCKSIVIKASAAGAIDMSAIGAAADGNPIAVGGGKLSLSFFMNHARHEIGHAVGAKAFKDVGEIGDEFAKTYGGWGASSKAGIVAAYWTKNGTTVCDWTPCGGSKTQSIHDVDVANWLAGYIEGGAEPAGNAITALPGSAAAKLAVLSSKYGSEQLFKYFNAIGGLAASKDNAYMFPGFTPSGGEVHIWCSRANPPGWTKYSTAAHTAMVSSHGWYSLASYKEMFAEMYTHKYSGGGVPAAVNGKDPGAFFKSLDESKDSDTLTNLGAPPAPAAGGAGGAGGGTGPATPQQPPPASNPPALG